MALIWVLIDSYVAFLTFLRYRENLRALSSSQSLLVLSVQWLRRSWPLTTNESASSSSLYIRWLRPPKAWEVMISFDCSESDSFSGLEAIELWELISLRVPLMLIRITWLVELRMITSLMFEALTSSLGRRSVGKRPELMTSILLTSAFFVKLFVNGSFWRLLTRGLRSGCGSFLMGAEANYWWVGSTSEALSPLALNWILLENARFRPTKGCSKSASILYSSGLVKPG